MKRRSPRTPAQKAAAKVRRVEWCAACRAFRRRGHEGRCRGYRERQALARLFWAGFEERLGRLGRYFDRFLP